MTFINLTWNGAIVNVILRDAMTLTFSRSNNSNAKFLETVKAKAKIRDMAFVDYYIYIECRHCGSCTP